MIALPPTRLRVRYSDVDRMGLLYHVNYLEFFEHARSDWIRAFWKPYKEIEDAGMALVVIEAHLHYLKSGKYDDELEVHAKLTDWGRSRFRFEYVINRVGDIEPLCTGWTAHCFIGRDGKPTKMPEELRDKLSAVSGTNNATTA